MTNTSAVCLVALAFFCCTYSTTARQVPKECSKGPEVWCKTLKSGAECGAVGHCIGTVWELQADTIRTNDISNQFVQVFKELKEIREFINENYLGVRLRSACRNVPHAAIAQQCKTNTAHYENYLYRVLMSNTTPETMCQIVGMCNNEKLDSFVASKVKATTPAPHVHKELVGASQCTWGPSYWCSNFSTGRQCKATHHCIERVWSKLEVADDTDDVCKICTDMVKQARDQLQSNETQEELKEVFEGSCKLIPIKIVAKECIKLADDFVPELVETLASQMNPQQVCSVAGLCNNVRIDDMLDRYKNQLQQREECSNCRKTVTVIRKRFDATSYEDFLVGLLTTCGKMSSLSDACSALVFKYYESILSAARTDLTPRAVCHVSAMCQHTFHQHDDFVFPNENLDALRATDDVPCEFCEKVVNHLRDTLIANTTETEFRRVLVGLCKQTGRFKDECLNIVDQYYDLIYSYLTHDMKPAAICTMMGICGNTTQGPVSPLVPKELAVKVVTPAGKLIGTDEDNSYKNDQIAHLPLASKKTNVVVMSPTIPPLPIERMFVGGPPQSKPACSFCQYFLHYLQVELSDVNNEDKIKEVVAHACDKLPQSVNGECKQFVTEYGPMVIALLVQEIDPASVCPAIGLCPQVQEVRKVSVNADKSNCPLCLFAVEELETIIKNNRTESSIKTALDGLCNHLSQKLRTQCVDFVDQYTEQLVSMLVANLNAQQICVYLKLCKDEVADPLKITHSGIDKFHEAPQLRADRNNVRGKSLLPKHMLENGDIETNEIPDNTVNGRPVKPETSQKTICVICEFVLKEIDDQIKDKHNEDEIKKIVHNVCTRMPKSVRSECDQFVQKYADLVISLLAQELEPDQVCQELKLCSPTGLNAVKAAEILDCAVCETVVMAAKKVLNNDRVDHNIVHIVEKSCALLPAKYSDRCHTMMEIYGDSVIHLVENYGAKQVCGKIGMCADSHAAYVRMYDDGN